MSTNRVLAFSKLMEPNEVYDFGWYYPVDQPVLFKAVPAAKPPDIVLHAAPDRPGHEARLVHPAPRAPSPERLNDDGSFPLTTGVEIVADRFGVRADAGPNGVGYAHLWKITNTSPNKEVWVEGWIFYDL